MLPQLGHIGSISLDGRIDLVGTHAHTLMPDRDLLGGNAPAGDALLAAGRLWCL
jgi:hypothetical protein